LKGVVRIRLDDIQRFACFTEDHLRQVAKHMDRISGYTDISQYAFFVPETAKFSDGAQDFLGGDEFAIVAIYHIEVLGA
jgi:hypothetical protein